MLSILKQLYFVCKWLADVNRIGYVAICTLLHESCIYMKTSITRLLSIFWSVLEQSKCGFNFSLSTLLAELTIFTVNVSQLLTILYDICLWGMGMWIFPRGLTIEFKMRSFQLCAPRYMIDRWNWSIIPTLCPPAMRSAGRWPQT